MKTITQDKIDQIVQKLIRVRNTYMEFELEEQSTPPNQRFYMGASDVYVEVLACALTAMTSNASPDDVFHVILDAIHRQGQQIKNDYLEKKSAGESVSFLRRAYSYNYWMVDLLRTEAQGYVSAQTIARMDNLTIRSELL